MRGFTLSLTRGNGDSLLITLRFRTDVIERVEGENSGVDSVRVEVGEVEQNFHGAFQLRFVSMADERFGGGHAHGVGSVGESFFHLLRVRLDGTLPEIISPTAAQ